MEDLVHAIEVLNSWLRRPPMFMMRGVARCEPLHPSFANIDLQPIAIMVKLVRPARSTWGLLGDDWMTRMDHSDRHRRTRYDPFWQLRGVLRNESGGLRPDWAGASPPWKQRVRLTHQPIGNEADPLLRGRVEADQGLGARSECGEWMRLVGSKFYRIRLHVKSGGPKASDSTRHMQG